MSLLQAGWKTPLGVFPLSRHSVWLGPLEVVRSLSQHIKNRRLSVGLPSTNPPSDSPNTTTMSDTRNNLDKSPEAEVQRRDDKLNLLLRVSARRVTLRLPH